MTCPFLLLGASHPIIKRDTNIAREKITRPGIRKIVKNKREKEHIIIFKEYITEIDSGRRGSSHERSPFTCAFGVRGHYRHYKDGRRIWVKEYVKGTGTKISKTYKIGGSKK